MALLWSLKYFGYDVVVAHINHGLRSNDSDGDEAFVIEHCHRIEVPVVTRRVEVATSGSVETNAREARYAALVEIAREQQIGYVTTGHTASDQLETVLMNWLRGAAITGLRGMEATRELVPQVLLVRPLLSITRDEVRELCGSVGWTWREDASNESAAFLRNRVRHQLLPCCEMVMNRAGARQQLERQTTRACEVLQADFELLDEIAQTHLAALVLKDKIETDCGKQSQTASHLLILDGVRWSHLPLSMQRRVLRAAVAKLDGGMLRGEIGWEKIETVRQHVQSKGRRKVWQWRRDLSVEWTSVACGNRIRLRLVKEPTPI